MKRRSRFGEITGHDHAKYAVIRSHFEQVMNPAGTQKRPQLRLEPNRDAYQALITKKRKSPAGGA